MRLTKRMLSVLLSVLMILSICSPAASALTVTPDEVVATLPFAAISDIHYYPPSFTGNNCEAWQEYAATDSKQYEESEALLYSALESIMLKAKTEGYKYLLIPGDLTRSSEYNAHVELAAILEEFERKSGIEVFVTNGNHDINVKDATTYENGYKETARSINQAEFREVYKNLGYDHAFSEYYAADGSAQNGLSYAADLGDDYMLIVVDSNRYDPVTPSKQQTGGVITEECMQWVKDMAQVAAENGKTPILMMHHSVAPHMQLEPAVTFAFCVDEYEKVAESFADAGIHFAFTGHLHTNDISSVVSDSGNVIYDCEVGPITGYPNTIRDLKITTYGDGESEITYNTFDVDIAGPVTVNGKTYSQPFRETSFAINFGGKFNESGYATTKDFLMGVVKTYLLPYITQMNEAGGINNFLINMGIDLEQIIGDFLKPYIGEGIKIGDVSILSVDNIMWFIEDLMQQVEALYINNPDELIALLDDIVTKLTEIQVSDVPCTKFIDTFHFGDASRGGNLGEFVLTAMMYWYTGNEDSSDDLFVQDVIKRFESGENVNILIDSLLDIILNDLAYDAILKKLYIRFDKMIDTDAQFAPLLADSIDNFINKILCGDTSYMGLVNTVFGLGVLPWDSVEGIIDELMDEYITESQIESLGYTFSYCLHDFTSDSTPKPQGDDNVTYSSEKVTPEVTAENCRLPSMVNVTLGDDATSANINWFTKYSVTGSDIEIYKADEFSGFTGTPTTQTDFTMSVSSEEVTVSYPGIDIGIAGLFYYDYQLNRHTVKLSNLEKGTTYYYRVGDAEKGWWSEQGSITTADGSKSVTFINVTDSQSQTPDQYSRGWAKVMNAAFEMYPDADLVLHTGDMVDNPKNVNHYKWLLNYASDELMNTYFMPVAGNHDDYGEYALTSKFTFPAYPEQDTVTGVYYSFDYNNVHFMMLNSNNMNSDEGLSDEQIEWLKADAAASDAQWKIVAIHKAPYSNGSHYDDDDVAAIREQLSVLMPELDIDIVFQGHDHVYMRTYALDNNLVSDTERVYLTHNGKKYVTDVNPTGTSYVITGTSGVKVYNQKDASLTDELFPRAEKIVDVTSSMFSAIEIVDGVLYFDAYTVDGDNVTNVDSFAIQKDTTQGEYAGDCEDVNAEEKNASQDNFFKKLVDFFKKLAKILYNIYSMYFAK